ncbi:hypothetical protein STHAL_18110 [Streptomyces halstedii]|uniref:Uncharacterized protein n=1 Tax=Streptomyces halstedii TaxID=1944 RepID=A0ABS6TT83_STRHA|nr:hypothetical protein [Streptomyces halstedii]MBV7671366.1 hypothetical protein [Streptomyces halstedii]
MTSFSLTADAPGGLPLAGLYTTNDVATAALPVDLATDTWRTILRVVVPVEAGDVLDVGAWFKVTNDVGYNVGVGAHLWAYDVDSGQGTAGPWWRLDAVAGSVGMNVTKDLHHLTLPVAVPYVVPEGWPAGHRIVIVLRADAHSTAWKAGDTLTVDKVGRLTVRRYVPA